MNDREKFLFDLQGFLVIRDFLTKGEVNALNAAIDDNIEKKGEDGNSFTGNSKTLVGTHKRGFFSGMLTWTKPWCNPYRDIIAPPKAIPYLNTIHGRGWRLDHEPFILTADKDSEGLMLHGSTDRHFDGSQYYTYRNGEMRCGMVVFQYQLADVNEGDGGLCVIRGSHKANFPSAVELREWEVDRDIVYNLTCKSGDLVIFNEATMHGKLASKDSPQRRSLLVGHSAKYFNFAGCFFKKS